MARPRQLLLAGISTFTGGEFREGGLKLISMEKQDIKNLSLEDLEKIIASIKEPKYRARQIFNRLYKKGVSDFNEMKNLPASLRDELNNRYCIGTVILREHLKAEDKTEKYLFKLSDGNFIESVLIYSFDRKTLCMSTQVGCKFACPFCASGSLGFIRNLSSSEIISQAMFLRYQHKHKITNFVFMGIGEPLDNYDNVIRAIGIMNEKEALDIGARRITISTCGIIPGINKLKNSGLRVNLSISLHAADDRLRNELVPINKIYPLGELIGACEEYVKVAGRLITLEYILIKNKNDSLSDAKELSRIAKKTGRKVNLIAQSEIRGRPFKPSSPEDINKFIENLKREHVNVNFRKSKGADIQAACGQLAGRCKDLEHR